jgi:DNA-directed RNA polymerase subunit alpha
MTTVKYGKIELPERMERHSLGPNSDRFVIEPFERGYAHTVGNSMRRVLLTSIEAPAILSVAIDGITHEYRGEQGIVEDMTNIVLNLKGALLRRLNTGENAHSRDVKVVKKQLNIDAEMIGGKEYVVTLGELFSGSDFEVVDPTYPIFSVTKPMTKLVEFKVGTGRGYVPSERQNSFERSIHEVVIDSCFSPVRRVNYYVENTRVGQDTDFDKLILEVTTDGRVTPVEAVSHASQIAVLNFEVFSKVADHSVVFDRGGNQSNRDSDELMHNLLRPISEIELSVRAANCLENAQIKTIFDLVTRDESEMLKYRNFGKKSLNEIKDKLSELGLSLGMQIEDAVLDKIKEQMNNTKE